jgi:ABC-type sugar transport system ATPase subunit
MRAELHRLSTVLATTTIYVTHDYVEALSLGNRIAVLDQGVIQQIGTPEQIYYQPASEFVARMVGQPGINILSCRVQMADHKIILADVNAPQLSFSPSSEMARALANYKDQEIQVGIRPGDIQLSFSPGNGDTISGRTELYEIWGRRGVVLVMVGEEQLSVLLDSDESVEINRPVWLDFSQAPLYLFNQAGARIAY